MPAFSPYEASVRNAANFVLQGRDTRNVYFGLGKSSVWGTPDDAPAILGTQQEKIDYWDNIITGIRRIDKKNIIPVIPRRTWTTSTAYILFDNGSEVPYDDAFYVINSLNEVFTVNTVGPGVSTDEPLLSSVAMGTGIHTANDGYLWQYEYTANSYEIQQTGTDWISVNFQDTEDGTDTEVNIDSFRRLGCRYVLLNAVADDTMMTGDYRQIGIMTNPRLSAAGNALVSTTDALTGTLLNYSGELIYLENRQVQNLAAAQFIDIKIILRF
jgi:hypothetical protein